MRKVKFKTIGGKEYEGYYICVAGVLNQHTTLLLVEDMDGNIYSIPHEKVIFTSPPVNMSPVKRLNLSRMSDALDRLRDVMPGMTLDDIIKTAEERNIIIEDNV